MPKPEEEEVLPIKQEEQKKENDPNVELEQPDPQNLNILTKELLPRPWQRSGQRIYHIKVDSDDAIVTTGDGRFIFLIPPEIGKLDLINVYAHISTVSSSGAVTVQIRNITKTWDLLNVLVSIDAGEKSSLTATTHPAIEPTRRTVDPGDELAIDVDSAGTGAQGLDVVLTFG